MQDPYVCEVFFSDIFFSILTSSDGTSISIATRRTPTPILLSLTASFCFAFSGHNFQRWQNFVGIRRTSSLDYVCHESSLEPRHENPIIILLSTTWYFYFFGCSSWLSFVGFNSSLQCSFGKVKSQIQIPWVPIDRACSAFLPALTPVAKYLNNIFKYAQPIHLFEFPA